MKTVQPEEVKGGKNESNDLLEEHRESKSGKYLLDLLMMLDIRCPLRKDNGNVWYCRLEDERCYVSKLKCVVWGYWCEQKLKSNYELSDMAKEKGIDA